MAPYLPIGYPPYIPYPPPPDKSSDTPVVYSAPYFLATLPSAVHSPQDASPSEPHYSTAQAFYQTAIYHHPSYLVPRNNASHSYPVYLTPVLHKSSNEATADEGVNGQL